MERPLQLRHGPLTVFVRAFQGCPPLGQLLHTLPEDRPVIWLDSARQHPVTGRWSLLAYEPWLTLAARGEEVHLHTTATTQVWRDDPLAALRRVLRQYRAPAVTQPHGRAIGLMGFLSYELNRWIEPTRLTRPWPQEPSTPELLWFGMRLTILVDHLQRRTWLVSLADPHSPSRLAQGEALESLRIAEAQIVPLLDVAPADAPESRAWHARGGPEPHFESLQATSAQEDFEAMVARTLGYVHAGEIFQANVAQRFTGRWQGSARSLYEVLRAMNPSPFGCFLSAQDLRVVSCSPERLVRVHDGAVETRPIAGTRPRGGSAEEDALNSLELLLSEKERAEHIMLVDLERNDLGRICTPGSVHVTELMGLEAYSHVIHIVSNISGRLRRGVDAVDTIRALFPGGTITGCPKVRCMELLRTLEPVPRGLYTGSLGVLGFDGTLDLNIAIRTIVIQGDRLSFHVGAGIVADSDPTREYHETLAKAGALVSALHHAQQAASESHG